MAENPIQGLIRPRRFIFSATGESEVYDWTKSMGADATLVTQRPGTEISVSGIVGLHPGMVVTKMSFTGKFDIRLEQIFDTVVFHFPTLGAAEFIHGSSPIAVYPGEASAIHSKNLSVIGVLEGLQHVALAMEHEIFVERLSDMLDRPIMQPIEFAPKASLQSKQMAGLAAFVHCLAGSDFGHLIGTSTLIAGDLPKIVADMFLQFWPHNHTHRLEQARPIIAPRHVKIALDYIHAHLTQLPSPDQLARISGVSLRSLQYAFRSTLGVGIDEYQRSVRLQKAKDEILRGSGRSIAEISLELGFSHPKQFSTAFKAAFGVTPTKFRIR